MAELTYSFVTVKEYLEFKEGSNIAYNQPNIEKIREDLKKEKYKLVDDNPVLMTQIALTTDRAGVFLVFKVEKMA